MQDRRQAQAWTGWYVTPINCIFFKEEYLILITWCHYWRLILGSVCHRPRLQGHCIEILFLMKILWSNGLTVVILNGNERSRSHGPWIHSGWTLGGSWYVCKLIALGDISDLVNIDETWCKASGQVVDQPSWKLFSTFCQFCWTLVGNIGPTSRSNSAKIIPIFKTDRHYARTSVVALHYSLASVREFTNKKLGWRKANTWSPNITNI